MSEVKDIISIENVYDNIATEFDKTRYSVWKGVKHFLNELPSGSFVGDIGCGNGKNMSYRKDLKYKGYDSSFEFVKLGKKRGFDIELGNILELKICSNLFDHTLCIAVIHHLETRTERVKAISELIRITKSNGKILIYVWASEQPTNIKGKNLKSILEAGDTYIPFKTSDGTIHQRFYHIYFEGELEAEIKTIKNQDFIIETSAYELGNYYVIIKKL